MGVGLLIGAWLARRKRFRQHAWCQSAIVLLNLAVILVAMTPSFRSQVLPRIPAKLGRPYFALATVHAGLGTLTEYKAWMRGVLVFWWLVLLLGFATYVRWYVPSWFANQRGFDSGRR